MESAALVAPLTHHPFVSKSQAPGGWNLLQQVAPLTHLAPVTHHRTVVGTCHWWASERRPNSLEYQISTAPQPFDSLVTGLVHGGDAVRPSPDNFEWEATKKRRINQIHILDKGLEPLGNICKTRVLRFYLCTSAFLHTNFSISAPHDASWISAEFYHFEPGCDTPSIPRRTLTPVFAAPQQAHVCSLNFSMASVPIQYENSACTLYDIQWRHSFTFLQETTGAVGQIVTWLEGMKN